MTGKRRCSQRGAAEGSNRDNELTFADLWKNNPESVDLSNKHLFIRQTHGRRSIAQDH